MSNPDCRASEPPAAAEPDAQAEPAPLYTVDLGGGEIIIAVSGVGDAIRYERFNADPCERCGTFVDDEPEGPVTRRYSDERTCNGSALGGSVGLILCHACAREGGRMDEAEARAFYTGS